MHAIKSIVIQSSIQVDRVLWCAIKNTCVRLFLANVVENLIKLQFEYLVRLGLMSQLMCRIWHL